MHALRRQKLRLLITDRYKGDRGAFLKDADITKGRLSQLLDAELPFGDARSDVGLGLLALLGPTAASRETDGRPRGATQPQSMP